ncbi:filamentous hemagglutinin outer membrane protein [Calothrix sp. NIES-4071]|nr:filamentous hemagglutinin outer membrane protein [Calothrix sp. NIES-4071]BAZ64235.1 filamentous hemagglutinin outer membrane protein [Calothrix sp. NIES-4105]
MLVKYFRAFVISCITASSLVASFTVKSLAQINPDTTLPNSSSVTVQGNTSIIEAGTTQGNNLFHSFKEFSVKNSSKAFFNNAANIQNIITRVTGQSTSNINGIIKANGGASLFLINPNGIIFGENAKLEIGGSFIGSTANAIQFGNLGTFSATNPLEPTPLLTINRSALLFSQVQASLIESNSVAPSGNNPSNAFTATGLRVPDGKSLLLVGADVNINNGGLYAFGGRVELAGLAGTGIVALNKNGDNFSLSFPNVNKSDVSLSNNATVNVRAGNDGSIAINAHNLILTGSSQLLAGIQNGLGTDNGKSGNIDINTTGTISFTNSDIFNNVEANTLGYGGDINIKTNILKLEDGADVSAITFGAGTGGDLKIYADKIEVIGASNDGYSSRIITKAESTATGAAGNLTIKTNQLLIQNGGQVDALTFGAGRSGDLKINATSSIELTGINTVDNRFPSGLFVEQGTKGATGNAGSLTINTPVLRVLNGANISASTFGAGNSGDLKIDADKIEVIGTSSSGSASIINTEAGATATGAAGNLTIKTNQLLTQNGGQINAITLGAGRGGDLKIDATSLIEAIGINNVDNKYSSGLFVQQETKGATGNAGNLTINTPVLRVLDGANVSASTFGSGAGGNLKIDARIIEVIGASSNSSSSKITAQANLNATGAAGDLTIKTNQLLTQNGGQISASTFGAGAGGDLKIDATSLIKLIGVNIVDSTFPSGLFVGQNTKGGTGNAGSLTINTSVLQVLDGANVNASTLGAGTAGDLKIDATSSVELRSVNMVDSSFSSGLFVQSTEGATGNAGNLTIKTNQLLVQDRARIATRSVGTGTAGNLTINAKSINLKEINRTTAT